MKRFDQTAAAVLDGRTNAEHAAAAKAARAHAMGGKIAAYYLDGMKDLTVRTAAPVIAHENSKLKDTDTTAFLIWNLPAVMTCPHATALCMGSCYARAAERFTDVRDSRLNNYRWTRNAAFVDAMSAALTATLYTKAGKTRKPFAGKRVVFRVHESGDFYSKAYMLAWFEIARRFPEITFFAYTKSFDILAACMDEQPANFTVRASIWADTNRDSVEWVAETGTPYYTAVPAAALAETVSAISGSAVCDCESGCGACNCMCAARAAMNIFAAIH